MNDHEIQSFHDFSEIHAIKESIEKSYPPTRSMTQVRRIRWGFADFAPDLEESLQVEGFVPIGLFKTTPVRPRVTHTANLYCTVSYHPQERIEALIYNLMSTVGFEFVRYNADSTITIATTDMRMLKPGITPDFYQRVGPDIDPNTLQTMDEYFAGIQEMLASLRAEPLPECGCLELNPEEFLQRFESRYARLMKEVDQKIAVFLESTKPAEKRYYQLDCIPNDSIEEVLKDRIHRFEEEKSEEKTNYSLTSAIYNVVYILCIKHLEFPEAIAPEPYIQQGGEIALDFFFGNWWQEAKAYEGLSEPEKNQALSWSEPFIHGMLFLMLLQRWDDLSKLCSWLDSDIEIDDTPDVEKEVLLVIKLVASSQLPEPMAGLEEIRTDINNCRLKQPKLLLKIWDAIEAMDQKEFEKTMKESLTHYLKSVDAYIKKGVFKCCVAEFQTVLCLIALKKGLAFPKLPEKLAAALVTRETLGLE